MDFSFGESSRNDSCPILLRYLEKFLTTLTFSFTALLPPVNVSTHDSRISSVRDFFENPLSRKYWSNRVRVRLSCKTEDCATLSSRSSR